MKLSQKQKQVHEKAVSIGAAFVAKEKELIEVFMEVATHEVFRAVGCASLYEYVLTHLHLTPDQAYTYTKIAQASRKSPELREAIQEKEINITSAKVVATLFSNRQVKLNEEKKSEILEKAKHCSVRELRRKLAEEFPQAGLREEKVREIDGQRLKLEFSVLREALERFRRVQDLVSNKKRAIATIEQAFDEIVLFYLEKNDSVEKAKRAERRKAEKGKQKKKRTEKSREAQASKDGSVIVPVSQRRDEEGGHEKIQEESAPAAKRDRPQQPSILSITRDGVHEFKPRPEREPIPAATLHELSLRDRGRCQHVLASGEICGSGRFVEAHHRTAINRGGGNDLKNLVTLCRAHHDLEHYH